MAGTVRVVLLAGGFGGARIAHGFALLGDGVALTVVVNTADDLELHGLHISPDLDTVMYTLAGLAHDETGWGVSDETWSAAEMLARFGERTWFRLGDRDLATHLVRTARLRAGTSLTGVTGHLAGSLGVRAELLPMTDDPVRTKVRTEDGWLDFQDYFVRRGHRDEVLELRFDGVDQAAPTEQVIAAIRRADCIVVAPSNPFVSVEPILALPGMLDALRASALPLIAVSPIVSGASVRGPAADMLRSLGGQPPTSAGVARHYATRYPGLIGVLVVDRSDAAESESIAAAGIRPVVTGTLISAPDDRARLAREIVTLAASLRQARAG